jgi:hypothetical protein
MYRPYPSDLAEIDQVIAAFRTGDNNSARQLFEDYYRNRNNLRTIRSESDTPADEPAHRRLGIWKYHEANGEAWYERDPTFIADWQGWADNEKIIIDDNAKKVVYIGESVARGYLFDPQYNPVKIIQHLVNTTSDLAPVQVIDLAMSGLDFGELHLLVREVAAIRPDALIIFAGNNWDVISILESDPEAGGVLAELIRPDLSADELTSRTAMIFERAIAGLLEMLKDIFPDTKLMFVIPEFNLKDWQSAPSERIMPRSLSGEMKQWVSLRDRAEACLKEHQPEELAALARELIKLDGTNPYGYELLAKYKLAKESFDEARLLLEAARDTAVYGRNFTSKPRCLSITRRLLKSGCEKFDIGCVDLPEVFRNELKGQVPGKEFFVDYCHLSAKSMQIACSTITSLLIKQLANKAISTGQLLQRCPHPDARTEAYAHFLAAIHNAHFGQPDHILHYHCSKAVFHDPQIVEVLLNFAKLASTRAPSVLCQTYRDMHNNGDFRQYLQGRALRHPNNKKILDADLVEVILDVLRQNNIAASRDVQDFMIEQHGISDSPENLLQTFYSAFNYYVSPVNSTSWYVSYMDRSEFLLVTEPDDMEFNLVVRNKELKGKRAQAIFCVNGSVVYKMEIGERWKSFRFVIARNFFNKGKNLMTIEWPLMEPMAEFTYFPRNQYDWWRQKYCCLGEIHSFHAQKPRKENIDITIDTPEKLTSDLASPYTS